MCNFEKHFFWGTFFTIFQYFILGAFLTIEVQPEKPKTRHSQQEANNMANQSELGVNKQKRNILFNKQPVPKAGKSKWTK